MKKAILMMKPMMLLAMIFSLTLGSCKKGWFDEENGHGGGNGGGGGNTPIKVTGMIEKVGCGKSIYGENLWIRTDAGELLQPCAQSFMTLCPIALKEGDRVEVLYRKYTGNMQGFEIYCKVAYFPHTKVVVDFIKTLTNNNSSCPSVTIINNKPDYDKLIMDDIKVKSARIEGSSLLLEITYGGCNNNTESIKLVGRATERSDLLTYNVMVINEKHQGCEVLITSNVCFDLSMLKATIDGKIRVHVEGTSQDLVF